MNIGVSPLSKRIYAGKSVPLENGKGRRWVGKKEDVTEEVMWAAAEWMHLNVDETGVRAIRFDGLGTLCFDAEEEPVD